jgi:hypothetical protein
MHYGSLFVFQIYKPPLCKHPVVPRIFPVTVFVLCIVSLFLPVMCPGYRMVCSLPVELLDDISPFPSHLQDLPGPRKKFDARHL